MKAIFTTLILAASLTSHASEPTIYLVDGKQTTAKVEALRSLIKSDNGSQVYECKLKEVSKKATLKNKE